MRMHTRTHTHTKEKQGSGEERNRKKGELRENKGLLVFCLNFPPLEGTHKRSLARPPCSLSRELGFRAKNKNHRKDREDYAPFKTVR